MTTDTRGAIAARDPAARLWAAAGACWAATVLLIALGEGRLASHDYIVERSALPWAVRIPAFLFVWSVMVGAMMLPTTVPMMRLVVAVSARGPEPRRIPAALLSSYVGVWVVFGAVALTGDLGVHAAVDHWAWLGAHSGFVLAGTLATAGAFQFSRLKDRCLTTCRDPLTMLWQHYGRGAAAARRLGLRHAMSCLGCCWALMLVMFGVGTTSIPWMLGLTAVMVAEKTTRWGSRLTAPIGVALLVLSAVVAVATMHVLPFAPTALGGEP